MQTGTEIIPPGQLMDEDMGGVMDADRAPDVELFTHVEEVTRVEQDMAREEVAVEVTKNIDTYSHNYQFWFSIEKRTGQWPVLFFFLLVAIYFTSLKISWSHAPHLFPKRACKDLQAEMTGQSLLMIAP